MGIVAGANSDRGTVSARFERFDIRNLPDFEMRTYISELHPIVSGGLDYGSQFL